MAKVCVIAAEIFASNAESVPSARWMLPWTMKVSAPEVEPWKGQAKPSKASGRPCSVRQHSGRGLRRRCAASAK